MSSHQKEVEAKKKYLLNELESYRQKQSFLENSAKKIYVELERLDPTDSQYSLKEAHKINQIGNVKSEIKKFRYDLRQEEIRKELAMLESEKSELIFSF